MLKLVRLEKRKTIKQSPNSIKKSEKLVFLRKKLDEKTMTCIFSYFFQHVNHVSKLARLLVCQAQSCFSSRRGQNPEVLRPEKSVRIRTCLWSTFRVSFWSWRCGRETGVPHSVQVNNFAKIIFKFN
jgi:hypothetical protein